MSYVPAVLGTARLGNFRLGYLPALLQAEREVYVTVLINDVAVCIRVGSVTIHDVINDAPNTLALVIDGSTPPMNGQTVRAYVNSNDPRLLFTGTLQTVDLSYEGRQKTSVYPCLAQDDTPRANRRIPLASYTLVSASTIAEELVANFAPGFTSANVQAGLPEVSILFDGSEGGMNGCLRALAKLVGGYFYWEDFDLHFFTSESPTDDPDPITEAYRFLEQPRIRSTSDDSQLRTRVYGKGHADELLTDVAIGETILPLRDVSFWNAGGGQGIAIWDVFAYESTFAGGAGTLVGPGVTPSGAPMLGLSAGAGVNSGAHEYAYTWVTGSGETLPSPVGTITTGELAPPSTAVGLSGPNAGGSLGIGIYKYAVTFVNASGETTPGPTKTAAIPTTAGFQNWLLQFVPIGPAGTTARKIYRTVVNGSQLKLLDTIANNVTDGYSDGIADGSLGADAPTSNTATVNQVTLAGIAVGPSGTTDRKVYRTTAGGSQLKLQQTIANNTDTTGVTDSTTDASLGADAPTADSSGLSQPDGQVLPGADTLVVATPAPFSADGGWAVIGNGAQVIRYTAIAVESSSGGDETVLTGIPASGPGAVVAAVSYNSTITAAPALTGVSGFAAAQIKGTPIAIWVQEDDFAAQAALTARDGTDGIIEHRIVDARRTEDSLRALCVADLAQFSLPLSTVQYATRDVKTKSGRPIAVNLTAPPIVDELVIQDVTITEINTARGVAPRFTVRASSARFSVEDLLRQLTGTLDGR